MAKRDDTEFKQIQKNSHWITSFLNTENSFQELLEFQYKCLREENRCTQRDLRIMNELNEKMRSVLLKLALDFGRHIKSFREEKIATGTLCKKPVYFSASELNGKMFQSKENETLNIFNASMKLFETHVQIMVFVPTFGSPMLLADLTGETDEDTPRLETLDNNNLSLLAQIISHEKTLYHFGNNEYAFEVEREGKLLSEWKALYDSVCVIKDLSRKVLVHHG